MREYSHVKKELLRLLSEDSRMPITTLAKTLKCSRNTVIQNMGALEKELGIKYIIDFNKFHMKVQKHILAIKFGKTKPSPKEINEIFQDDNDVQFVAITEGDFDLLIYLIVSDSTQYLYWSRDKIGKLLKYSPTISQSLIVLVYAGFTQLPNATLKKVNLTDFGIDGLDKKLLLLLNDNARLSYAELSRKLGESQEKVRYRLRKIQRKNLIRRFSILITNPKSEYNIAFLLKYKLTPEVQDLVQKMNRNYVKYGTRSSIINTFPCLSITSGTHLFFGLGCFNSRQEAQEAVINKNLEVYAKNDPEILSAQIIKTAKGSLPIRNMDIKKEFIYPN